MNLTKNNDASTILASNFTTSGIDQNAVNISVENRWEHARTMKVLLEPRHIYGINITVEKNSKIVEFRVASYYSAIIMHYTIVDLNQDDNWLILAEKRVKDIELERKYLTELIPRLESKELLARILQYRLKQYLQGFAITTPDFRINGIGGTIKPTNLELAEHLKFVNTIPNFIITIRTCFNFVWSEKSARFSMRQHTLNRTSIVYHYRLVKVEDQWFFDEEFNDGEYLTDKIVENRNLKVLRWGDNYRH
ncbi:unnamed protein product [Caenorhabditis angaria]|uniref:Uncharacterized protein n=1 Tax=Caenorhabditis angaria TaxID=860376 RepID=A0A9P1IJH6_9PELO|nr:unnamed protein product [Caenorhabditis angaria]